MADEAVNTETALGQNVPLSEGLDGQTLHEMFCVGWKILPTSCVCGGNYAWLKPRKSGALEMVGCVCHNTNSAMMQFKAALSPNAQFSRAD